MSVVLRLLGEVDACADGRVIDVGHSRQRCVLVALLVDANHLVPVERLLDRVWADRPPQRARQGLSGYVSRLRQVLAFTGEVTIARRPGGYLLSVDPMSVDLHRFYHLVAQARAATDEGAALAMFEQALGLWRGEAFATLDTPWLNDMRVVLQAQRLAAEMDRNDLALACGRHAELLGELCTRAAAYPLDERLAGQLILALYRCGRQGEALRRYEQLRVGLAEELGADPSPPLQRLHQQILTAEQALAPAASVPRRPARTSGPSTVPRQLPAPPRAFTGRARELAMLDLIGDAAGEKPTSVIVSAVSGAAGVGKTALAVWWAHHVVDAFPDGQLYVNLRGFDPSGSAMTPAAAVRGFLDAFEISPQRIPVALDSQTALFRSLLSGRRMLIVLDNARDSAQVRPLLPGASTCLVLVTSRNQLSGLVATDGAHLLTLDLLSTAEARELLTHRLGPQRVTAEPQAVEEIITRCARLPLALAIVAARATTHPQLPLRTLADQLRDAHDRLDTLTLGDDPNSDVRVVFSWSYHTLTQDAARLFRLLGQHPGPDICTPAAASLAALPPPRVRPLLAELVRANLVVEHIPGRYVFHDLLRAYATDLAHRIDPDQPRRAATYRMLDHYLHTAYAADRLLYPAREPITLTPPRAEVTPEHLSDHEQALAWFTAEHAVLLAAVDHAAATGWDTHTWQLAWTLGDFLNRRGHWHDQATVQRIAVAAAQRLGDPFAQAQAHRLLAFAYTRLGRFQEAHTQLRHALDLAVQAGDRVEQAHTHRNLTMTWGQQGRHIEALDHARQALDLFQAAGHRHGQALAFNLVGWLHALLGDHTQALTSCQQALTLHQELDNRYGQAATWDSLGYAHHHLGHHTQAITCYQHALDLLRDLGDRYTQAGTLTHLGDTHHANCNLEAARAVWRQALTILDDLDHPDAEQVRTKLG